VSRVFHFVTPRNPCTLSISTNRSLTGNLHNGPRHEDYWLIKTGPKEEAGIDGGLIKRRGPIDGTAVIAYVCTVKVSSVGESVSKVTSSGRLYVVPTMAMPGVGWLA
jgi:uncharacterized protein